MSGTDSKPPVEPTADTVVPPYFVAYVYPGWHRNPYRAGLDEWALLDTFRPYFTEHKPPPRPLSGPYDDSDPTTAASQIMLAERAGVRAFMYFTYYRPNNFIMAGPMETALAMSARLLSKFAVAATWCVRLPHDHFPVPPRDVLAIPAATDYMPDISLDEKPIELLTLRDLDQLGEYDHSGRLKAAIDNIVIAEPESFVAHRAWRHAMISRLDTCNPASTGEIEEPLSQPKLPVMLTLRKLRTVLETLAELIAATPGHTPDLGEIAGTVRRLGLSELPLGIIAQLVEAVRPAHGEDVLTVFTLRQLEDMLSRVATA